MKVVRFQWPYGTPARNRFPLRAQPRVGVTLMDAQVSSMKTSFDESR
jgi:hypothetical protein